MAAGKACIGAINGETARLVQTADCGSCAPAEDAAALAQILKNGADHPQLLRRQGQNARKYYDEHFRKETFMDTLLTVLQENC